MSNFKQNWITMGYTLGIIAAFVFWPLTLLILGTMFFGKFLSILPFWINRDLNKEKAYCHYNNMPYLFILELSKYLYILLLSFLVASF